MLEVNYPNFGSVMTKAMAKRKMKKEASIINRVFINYLGLSKHPKVGLICGGANIFRNHWDFPGAL